jgi:hypothetical protein
MRRGPAHPSFTSAAHSSVPVADPVQSLRGKFLHFYELFYKLFPMREEAMSVAMIHDAVGKVLRDSGKLGEFFRAGSVDTDFATGFCGSHDRTLEGRNREQVG